MLPQKSLAQTTSHDAQPDKKAAARFHITLMYSPQSQLGSAIATQLSAKLQQAHPDFQISALTAGSDETNTGRQADLVVAIGFGNMHKASEQFPKTGKLFIASEQQDYSELLNNSQNALLYMTQPYCRQIRLIQLINDQWRTFSYLTSASNSFDDSQLRQCALNLGMETYKVSVDDNAQPSNAIKQALNHSDLILALPDKEVFNRNTVKNILLTSYRHRKPVIAFSRNFVSAGALASVYSDIEQIAESASLLVDGYLAENRRFSTTINYPQFFQIEINRQVFKALAIDIPDVDKLKQRITDSTREQTR